jgi:hypothetical protein
LSLDILNVEFVDNEFKSLNIVVDVAFKLFIPNIEFVDNEFKLLNAVRPTHVPGRGGKSAPDADCDRGYLPGLVWPGQSDVQIRRRFGPGRQHRPESHGMRVWASGSRRVSGPRHEPLRPARHGAFALVAPGPGHLPRVGIPLRNALDTFAPEFMDTFSPSHSTYVPFPDIPRSKSLLVTGCMQSFKYLDSLSSRQQPPFRLKQQQAAALWMHHRRIDTVVHVRIFIDCLALLMILKKWGRSDFWPDPREVIHFDVIFPLLQELRQWTQQLKLVKVKSHSGCQLNEMADELADIGRASKDEPICPGPQKYGSLLLRIQPSVREQIDGEKTGHHLPRDG